MADMHALERDARFKGEADIAAQTGSFGTCRDLTQQHVM
jgi:hypothetical protein